MKAMILAAGRGERMRPLTHSTPKPLLKINGYCLIEHHLIALKKAGIREVIINVSYHSQQFVDALGHGERYGLQIVYSYEENGPLGTGGGIYKALSWIDNSAFIVISGDIWTDFCFETLMTELLGDAHLVMVENPDYSPQGDFCLLDNGQITLGTPKLTYGNIAVFHPRLFANQKAGEYPLAPLLQMAIKKGRVTGEFYRGIWHNVGTPKQLHELCGHAAEKNFICDRNQRYSQRD